MGWEDEGGGGGNSWRRQRARKINGWPPVATEQGKETRITHEKGPHIFCNHYINVAEIRTRARAISGRSAKFEQEMKLIHPSWINLKTNRIHRRTIQVVRSPCRRATELSGLRDRARNHQVVRGPRQLDGKGHFFLARGGGTGVRSFAAKRP